MYKNRLIVFGCLLWLVTALVTILSISKNDSYYVGENNYINSHVVISVLLLICCLGNCIFLLFRKYKMVSRICVIILSIYCLVIVHRIRIACNFEKEEGEYQDSVAYVLLLLAIVLSLMYIIYALKLETGNLRNDLWFVPIIIMSLVLTLFLGMKYCFGIYDVMRINIIKNIDFLNALFVWLSIVMTSIGYISQYYPLLFNPLAKSNDIYDYNVYNRMKE